MTNYITTIPKTIAYWLVSGCLLISLMVIIGGITRLTHSGLSIVKWDPISGTLPPMNQEEWQEEFEHYQTSPEFKKINYFFTLEDFKSIFWWEYIHRLLGRIIGIVFIVPFCFFLMKKQLQDKKLLKHLLLIFLLGALQGLIGWLMVASGLVDQPNVSHYRLALHLSTALFLVAYIFWVALALLIPHEPKITASSLTIRKSVLAILTLVSVQIIYGAFVAGLKAGYMFPTFPMMGSEWIPEQMHIGIEEQGLLAFLEHPVVVQFMHRWVGVVVLTAIVVNYYLARKKEISKRQNTSLLITAVLVSIQFFLGVFTILYSVPVILGLVHQFVAQLLLLSLVYSLYCFRKERS